jgi:SAM-dependent methyltransferase
MRRKTYDVYYVLKDAIEKALGKRDDLTPPTKLILKIGGGNFQAVGSEFMDYFLRIGALQPHERVLDIGCGTGRMAVPLTDYLNESGRYEGFDIMPEGISWSQSHLSLQYPNFNFVLADIFNNVYHPEGRYQASEYVFPYEDDFFDFIFAVSVFTHILPGEIENYFSQASRVLKPGGRSLFTFMLLNDQSLDAIQKGMSDQPLIHTYQEPYCRIINEQFPESVVGYDEHFVRDLYAQNGLKISEPIFYGSWSGRDSYLSYQDIIKAVKSAR